MNEDIIDAQLTPEQEQMKAQIIRDTDKNIKNLLKYPGRVRRIKRLQKQIHNLLVHIRDQDRWVEHLLNRHVEDMSKTTKGPHYIYAPKKNHIHIGVAISLAAVMLVIGILVGVTV